MIHGENVSATQLCFGLWGKEDAFDDLISLVLYVPWIWFGGRDRLSLILEFRSILYDEIGFSLVLKMKVWI
jgi:hypothetical protein